MSTQSPGPAPEIAQARVREQMAREGIQTVPGTADPAQAGSQGPPQPPAPPEQPVEGGDGPPVPPPVPPVDVEKEVAAGRIPLATLPDADIFALVKKYGMTANGREAAIVALGALGIDSVAAGSL